MRLAVSNACRSADLDHLLVLVVAGSSCFLDAAFGLVLLPGYAPGVDPQQDINAVPSPGGDLRRGDSGIEPGGHGGVTEVVRTAGQQGSCLAGGEGSIAGLVEDLEVGPVVEDTAAGASENPPGRCGRIFFEVLTEERHKLGVDGDSARLPPWAVFEFAPLASRTGVCPLRAAPGLGVRQDQLAPAASWQAGQVVSPQVDNFLGPERGIVQKAEERNHPLTSGALVGDCCEQSSCLVAVDHGSRIYGLGRARPGPVDGSKRVCWQPVGLNGVLHQVVQ